MWVVAEQNDGQLHDVGLELLSKGRELAATLGVRLSAVVIGAKVAEHSPTASSATGPTASCVRPPRA